MKKRIVALSLLLTLCLSGCGGNADRTSADTPLGNPQESQEDIPSGNETDTPTDSDHTFEMSPSGISITLPEDWENNESPQYDLQYTNGKIVIHVKAYQDTDIPEGGEPFDIYGDNCEELIDQLDDADLVGEESFETYDDKMTVTELWTVQKDGIESYYYSCYVEFPNEYSAWIWFSGEPSDILAEMDTLNEIVVSTTCNSISY